MDVRSDYIEPVTPGYDSVNYWKNEDSGYHTSLTPGSLECSEILNDNLNPAVFQGKICITRQIQVDCYDITPEINLRLGRKCSGSANLHLLNTDSIIESPRIRRGIKRPFQEDSDNPDLRYSSVPTPTSVISGGLRRLQFNDANKLNASFPSVKLAHTDVNEFCHFNEHIHTSFPTTPVKSSCRTTCKLNSPSKLRRSATKFSLVMHSLSCESQGLQPVQKPIRAQSKIVPSIQFRPEQKIDIIKMLYQKAHVMPPIMKIFSYLSNEDIYNFSLVSPVWLQVWEDVSKVKSKKQDYMKFLKNVKENQENKYSTPKNSEKTQIRPLMEIHNVLNNHNHTGKSTPTSPPGTPRTIKFKRFAKSASLDLRLQISCVRCHQPAKVTEENLGEEWAECTSMSCSYQFCRFCSCDRHPGKSCIRYDLDGPSPSKRKKNPSAAGTKKSRKNLRRLL